MLKLFPSGAVVNEMLPREPSPSVEFIYSTMDNVKRHELQQTVNLMPLWNDADSGAGWQPQ